MLISPVDFLFSATNAVSGKFWPCHPRTKYLKISLGKYHIASRAKHQITKCYIAPAGALVLLMHHQRSKLFEILCIYANLQIFSFLFTLIGAESALLIDAD